MAAWQGFLSSQFGSCRLSVWRLNEPANLSESVAIWWAGARLRELVPPYCGNHHAERDGYHEDFVHIVFGHVAMSQTDVP